MPQLSFAQRFEFSEMAGYSKPFLTSTSYGYLTFSPGFSNQLTCNYYFTPHASLGAFYEINAWSPLSNSPGLTADLHWKHFYWGVNISWFNVAVASKTMKETAWGVTDSTTYRYSPSVALGMHIGYRQPLSKQVALNAQLGCNYTTLKEQESSPEFNNIGPVTFPNGTFSQGLSYYYMLAGITYRL